VLVIGAGVAGLAAIGTAKGCGCVVKAFDVRAAVREQIESMGAEFLVTDYVEDGSGGGGYAKESSKAFADSQLRLFETQAPECDIIITTALIPGRPAPKLITTKAVRAMKPNSVIVDLAAEQGGNCELTAPGQLFVDDVSGVSIIGYTDLPSRMAAQASELYATNVCHMLDDLKGGWNFNLNLQDEIFSKACVVHDGNILWSNAPPAPAPLPPPPPPSASPKSDAVIAINIGGSIEQDAPVLKRASSSHGHSSKSASPSNSTSASVVMLALAALFFMVGAGTDQKFESLFLVFVLSIVVGYYVVWGVAAALHTPLMALTNAISGIIVLGTHYLFSFIFHLIFVFDCMFL
jgi:NAD(P) transhydrogenase subunit alpha